MEIAIVTHNVIPGDGQGRANYEIAREALVQGHTVHLIADSVADDLISLGAKLHRIPLSSVSRKVNLWKVYEFARRADRVVAGLRPRVQILHNYGYCMGGPHHINTSQYVHSAWRKSAFHTARQNRNAYGAYQWTYSFLNAVWERRAYARAKMVVAASSTVHGELQEIGVEKERLRVILNGADLTEFYPNVSGRQNRQPWNLPKDAVLGLFAGDIRTPRKNLDSVLKALARVPGTHLAVVGRVAGSPFPALAQQLGIADRVHFLDFRRDIAELMRQVDFFIFPSRYEACSLVLVEAVASGLPVITAKTTGGAEVVADAGIQLDDPNDIDGLSGAISRISDDTSYRASLAEKARTRSPLCSWSHVTKQYLDLYHEVAR